MEDTWPSITPQRSSNFSWLYHLNWAESNCENSAFCSFLWVLIKHSDFSLTLLLSHFSHFYIFMMLETMFFKNVLKTDCIVVKYHSTLKHAIQYFLCGLHFSQFFHHVFVNAKHICHYQKGRFKSSKICIGYLIRQVKV